MQLSPSVTLESHPSVIDCLEINNAFAFAKISLFGGHVLSFCPKHDQRERLWISDKSKLDGSKAIRGGVPVCWPWFGPHNDTQYPAHGYVREQQWHVTHCQDTVKGTEIILAPETCVGAGFDGLAAVCLKVTIGKQLHIELITENIGNSPFTFNAALHSYFKIEDIEQVRLNGVSGQYIDKLAQGNVLQTPSPYTFSAETDRIHLNPLNNCQIQSTSYSTNIQSDGHDSLVVWNPWIDKSAGMSDMTHDGYQTMLCVESAITQGRVLAVNEKHCLAQTIA
ncbi:D-hexose-6-phosphate mutarotase [Neptunicella sp.]|uniref:D-hexose-6-phosphate mutarotase n=1 Tax=Neptunicella sp. TaxID=2125986 RepID=UPI003F69275D